VITVDIAASSRFGTYIQQIYVRYLAYVGLWVQVIFPVTLLLGTLL